MESNGKPPTSFPRQFFLFTKLGKENTVCVERDFSKNKKERPNLL